MLDNIIQSNINLCSKQRFDTENFSTSDYRKNSIPEVSFLRSNLSKVYREIKLPFLSFIPWIILLSGCNNDTKKLIGLAGNTATGAIETLFQQSPPDSSVNYTISTTSPPSLVGDGSLTLPIEITNPVIGSPNISGYPILDLSFSAQGTIDFTNISDVKNLVISGSSSGATITNLSSSLDRVYVTEIQTGDWTIDYLPDSNGILYLDWTNNTGASVDLTSMVLNETSVLAIKNSGNEPITIASMALDPEDTQRIEIGNDNDGNIVIAPAVDIAGAAAIKTISLTTWNDGDITLATPNVSGIPSVANLNSLTVNASKMGNITLGDLGNTSAINDASNFSLVTQGADVATGKISAKKIDNFLISAPEFSSVSVGLISVENSIANFTINGSGNVLLDGFEGSGTVKLNGINYNNGLELDFSKLSGAIDISATSFQDLVLAGIGGGSIITGSGSDIVMVAEQANKDTYIKAGDDVDLIILSATRGTDLIDMGGTNVNLIEGGANVGPSQTIDPTLTTEENVEQNFLNAITADTVINFETARDKIAIGNITSTVNNFSSNTGATDFSSALSQANSAMSGGVVYFLSYDVAAATSGFSLLFYDNNNDGASDHCINIMGLTTNSFTHENLIIASSDLTW